MSVTRSKVFNDYHREQFKEVKNLGWLLRNYQSVKEFRVYIDGLSNTSDDAVLVAVMRDGRIYETGFASKDILWSWLQRPVFYSIPLIWDGKEMEVTKGNTKP